MAEPKKRDYLLSNRVYNTLQLWVRLVLPALGTLYFTLSGLWDLPKATEVIGTLTALATFGGVLLGLSSSSYKKREIEYDGVIEILEDDDTKQYRFDLGDDPDQLEAKIDNKKAAVFKVEDHRPSS